MAIRNPFELALGQLTSATTDVGRAVTGKRRPAIKAGEPPPVARITISDLWTSLKGAAGDLGAQRTDVIFLCLIYPVAGVVLAAMAGGKDLWPLLFPLASGFALVGPFAAIGLYEISREREEGHDVHWSEALGVVHAPGFKRILALGLALIAVFAVWMAVAWGIYQATLGPEAPASFGDFLRDVFTTGPGWTMIVVGCAVGFVFAAVVLAISVVSFPMLVDRDVSVGTAVATSWKATRANLGPIAVWGLIVAAGLVLGSLPALVGLIVVLPVLGHATWRLYRKLVPAG